MPNLPFLPYTLPSELITIAGNDGDDAKLYLEKEVNRQLEKLKAIQEQGESE